MSKEDRYRIEERAAQIAAARSSKADPAVVRRSLIALEGMRRAKSRADEIAFSIPKTFGRYKSAIDRVNARLVLQLKYKRHPETGRAYWKEFSIQLNMFALLLGIGELDISKDEKAFEKWREEIAQWLASEG